ncbi:ATP-dependent DNA helicase [hydrothermal vent metagenome]|uniref:ATP-dependent DNA helicase n=1 Tax=hydrothermal vent metagenome TaxID=652676 RepID=A0A3B0T2R4_9ZZZZ
MPGDWAPRDRAPGDWAPGARVTAVLGPTNTGKTHLAIERMTAHQTGMIGLPLRLLAREVYDRVAEKMGKNTVALITGEEKILPRRPRFYVSTVEAMPLDISVEFLAVDEIQLAANAERGHIFTHRLLNARGRVETMMLGAASMRPLMEQLLTGANFVTRPRFSLLTYSGPKKISRLPRRSAIVAFSADGVYAIAETIRRQRGGAAVVLGALSPRTRNAQVELYQNGDVDFIVATDAIGMGLNMNVDHVAFSATCKFDGVHHRNLNAAELAQIAGRAGRHMNDGTFGITGKCEPLDDETVASIEQHRFAPLKVLQWRSDQLDFSSAENLIVSLNVPPKRHGLTRARADSDFGALEFLVNSDQLNPPVNPPARGPAAVKTLWEACQIPDFRKVGVSHHAAMVGRIYGYILGDTGVVPEDWMAKQLAYADRTDGDIDTLATRISHVRTWTFISNRAHWLKDASHWQERTRAIEDKLSDALHERLTQRFVDRRTSVLMKRIKDNETLLAGVSDDGDVTVEGEFIGKLDGLRFALDTASQNGVDTKALRAAALKVLAGELGQRAAKLVAEDNVAFALTDGGYITWRGAPVARLEGSDRSLAPRLKLLADEQIAPPDHDAVEKRLAAWLTHHIAEVLAPLFALEADTQVTGLARGVGFRVAENLGLLAREDVAGDVHLLDQPSRATLRRHGLRFGAFTLFFPLLLKPQAAGLRLLLFKLAQEASGGTLRDDWPDAPTDGLTSFAVAREAPKAFYEALGYRICGARAVRADMLERLGDALRPLINWKPGKDGETRPEGSHASGGFTVTPTMMSLVGCSGEAFAEILTALGFERQKFAPPAPAPADQSKENLVTALVITAAVEDTEPVPPSDPKPGSSPETETGSGPEPEAATPDQASADQDTSDVTAPPQTLTASEAASPEITDPKATTPQTENEAPEPIDVWRPKGRRPERRRTKKIQARRPDADKAGKENNKNAGKPGKSQRGKPAAGRPNRNGKDRPEKSSSRPPGRDGGAKPPRRREPEYPKDSPFAVLKALKASMEKDKPKS